MFSTASSELPSISRAAGKGFFAESPRKVAVALGRLAPRRALALVSALAVSLFGTAAFPGTAAAAPLPCGTVITRSTTLTADVGPCPGDGLIIGANNVVLNLNGHTLSGTGGSSGVTAGIRLPMRTGVQILGGSAGGSKGTVTGFAAGVFLGGGSNNLVQGLTVRDNIGPTSDAPDAYLGDGIVLFRSASNRILDNLVQHNGPYDGIGVLGVPSNGNTIQNNDVTDTVGVPFNVNFTGTGIVLSSILDEGGHAILSIYDNKVQNNRVRRNTGSGVTNASNVRGVITGNVVQDNGLAMFGTTFYYPGSGVEVRTAGTADYPDHATYVLVKDNDISHNGITGVRVYTGASNNRIEANKSFGNGTAGIHLAGESRNSQIVRNDTGYNGIVDLEDDNVNYDTWEGNCDHNVWFANTWGPPSPAFPDYPSYYPDCVTAGGSGPLPPATPVDVSPSAARPQPRAGSSAQGSGAPATPSRRQPAS